MRAAGGTSGLRPRRRREAPRSPPLGAGRQCRRAGPAAPRRRRARAPGSPRGRRAARSRRLGGAADRAKLAGAGDGAGARRLRDPAAHQLSRPAPRDGRACPRGPRSCEAAPRGPERAAGNAPKAVVTLKGGFGPNP